MIVGDISDWIDLVQDEGEFEGICWPPGPFLNVTYMQVEEMCSENLGER